MSTPGMATICWTNSATPFRRSRRFKGWESLRLDWRAARVFASRRARVALQRRGCGRPQALDRPGRRRSCRAGPSRIIRRRASTRNRERHARLLRPVTFESNQAARLRHGPSVFRSPLLSGRHEPPPRRRARPHGLADAAVAVSRCGRLNRCGECRWRSGRPLVSR